MLPMSCLLMSDVRGVCLFLFARIRSIPSSRTLLPPASRSNTTTTWPWSLLPVSVSRILRASRLPVSFACGVCKVSVVIDGILKQRVIGFVAIDCRVGLFAVAMRDRKLRRDEV